MGVNSKCRKHLLNAKEAPTQEEIIDLLRDMNKLSGVTVVTATHDHKMLDVSDRVVLISDGRIERIILRADLKIEVGTIDGKTE